MAFTDNTLKFLKENHKQDSREWFAAHKSDYKNQVEKPMLELAEALAPVMLRLDPLLRVEPKGLLSRIWRDVRFSKDKSIFKRASWIIFQRSKGMVHPCFFFEVAPDFHRYGCGYYSAPARVMADLRQMVLANDPGWLAAREALAASPGFVLFGDRYKRPRYPQATAEQRAWLDLKSIAVIRTSQDTQELFSDQLADRLAASFAKLKPIYDLLIKLHEG